MKYKKSTQTLPSHSDETQPETWLGAVVLVTLVIFSWKTFFPHINLSAARSLIAPISPSETEYPAAAQLAQAPAAESVSAMSSISGTAATATPSAQPTSAVTPSPTPEPTSTPAPTTEPTPVAEVVVPTATPTPVVAVRGKRIKVRNGETFWILSKKYCRSYKYADDIARQNGYTSGQILKTGATLVISCAR